MHSVHLALRKEDVMMDREGNETTFPQTATKPQKGVDPFMV